MNEMTAIKILKFTIEDEKKYFNLSDDLKDYYNILINALEKQIPRKLYIEEDADTNTYYCKNCEVEIYQKGCMHIRRAVLIPGKPKYCYNCGQRLDWEV